MSSGWSEGNNENTLTPLAAAHYYLFIGKKYGNGKKRPTTTETPLCDYGISKLLNLFARVACSSTTRPQP
jgi:hypothetical protein